MYQLELTSRPERKSMAFTWSMLGYIGLAIGFFLMEAISTPDPQARAPWYVVLVLMVVMLAGLSPILLDDWRYNRRYPDLLQKYLQSPLSPQDYDELRSVAEWHPEVQPWIAEVMDADGRIRYRDAELLEKRINQYLSGLPKKKLQDMVHQPPRH